MIIYFNFSMQGYDKSPNWAEQLYESQSLLQAFKWNIFNPYIDCKEQLLQSSLGDELVNKLPPYKAVKNKDLFKLENSVFLPLDQVAKRLFDTDNVPLSKEIKFKDIYFLIRSDVIITDLDRPSFGWDAPQKLFLAYLLDIPVIGITQIGNYSAWAADSCSTIINYKGLEQLVKTVKGFSKIEFKEEKVDKENLEGLEKEKVAKALKALKSLLDNQGSLPVDSAVEVFTLLDKGKKLFPGEYNYDELHKQVRQHLNKE